MKPSKAFYVPFVFVAIVWAVSIHTVTAFLYVGLGGRPFWNSAIIAPRFLASAFAAGPALIILTLQVVRHYTRHRGQRRGSLHAAADRAGGDAHQHVPPGLRGLHGVLHRLAARGLGPVPVFWSGRASRPRAVDLDGHRHEPGGDQLWVLPASRGLKILNAACVLSIVGIWIEKGMGLIVPAFIPTPLGEIVEYVPTAREIVICVGIWAFGLLLYTIFVRVSVPVLAGDVTCKDDPGE